MSALSFPVPAPRSAADLAAWCDATQPSAIERRQFAEAILARPGLVTDVDLIATFRLGAVAEDVVRAVVTHPAATVTTWLYVARHPSRPLDLIVLARHVPARHDPQVAELLRASGHPIVLRYCARDAALAGPAAFHLALRELMRVAPAEAVRLLEEPEAIPHRATLTADLLAPALSDESVIVRMRAQLALRVGRPESASAPLAETTNGPRRPVRRPRRPGGEAVLV